MIAENVLDLIGNTPMVRVNRLNPDPNLEMFLKLEKFNPGGSVKDRITEYMIEQAEKDGQLREGMTVIMAPDAGEKYLSTTLCDPALCLDAVRKFGIRCSYKDGKPIARARVRTSKRQS